MICARALKIAHLHLHQPKRLGTRRPLLSSHGDDMAVIVGTHNRKTIPSTCDIEAGNHPTSRPSEIATVVLELSRTTAQTSRLEGTLATWVHPQSCKNGPLPQSLTSSGSVWLQPRAQQDITSLRVRKVRISLATTNLVLQLRVLAATNFGKFGYFYLYLDGSRIPRDIHVRWS